MWVWPSLHIDLYTEISRQSCDPETPHKAVSVRCAFPAVPDEQIPSTEGWRPGDLEIAELYPSPMHVVKQHLQHLPLLSCLFFFFHEAIVFSLNQRKIFLLPRQSMSAIWVNVWWHNTPYWPLPSLSLLPWSYSSRFMGWKLWQGLLIFLNSNGLLMLLRVIFT